MFLSYLDILDLFFRFVIVGQLSLLMVFAWNKQARFKSLLDIGLMLCIGSYLLLTTRIDNHHYGPLRGLFLFFTELLPYMLWCFVFSLLKDNFHPKNWPLSVNILLVAALLWFSYFFGYLEGQGSFHQFNHVLGILISVHVIYASISDLNNDLVNSSRISRLFVAIVAGLYLAVLALMELAKTDIMTSAGFSLVNSILLLVAVSSFALISQRNKTTLAIDRASAKQAVSEQMNEKSIPLVHQKSYDQLITFMNDGRFTQPNLTIKLLAQSLAIPEHQLRELINKHLGFRNFSLFLNSYRIQRACHKLKDANNIRTPILTIALDLGYGSIGPFNRAFKEITQQTPSQYRQEFVGK